MPSQIIKSQLANIPETSGIYQFFDANDQVLYIGKAKNLRKRLNNYTQPERLCRRIERMVFLAEKLEFTQTKTEVDALLLEHNLIKKFSPKYNILLRDDKTFPHILISKHRFSQIIKHRGSKKDGGEYFGPFAAANDVNKTIDVLKKSFLLRGCSDSEFSNRTKPCLEYQIKRCSGPCANMINEADYEKSVNNARNFLSGKSVAVQESLAKEMLLFSERQEYEKAAGVRDRIQSLTAIQSNQNINISNLGDADVITLVSKNNQACIYISFFRGGNNYGSKSYFYEIDVSSQKNTKNSEDIQQKLAEFSSNLLSSFLGQFYLSQIPPDLILLNLEISEKDLIEEFLTSLNDKKTNVKTPKQGDRLKIIKDQETLALQNLEQKLAQNLSNQARLVELKNIFNLEQIPKRIEVYDNSHISGQYAVGVFITAGLEGFIKNGYRKFNIRFDEIKNRDDTAMLREVLMRRFKKEPQKQENNKDNDSKKIDNLSQGPDLIIIDGGLGQLSAARKVFEELNINPRLVCMSKGEDRNAGEEYFHQIGQESFTLPKTHKAMYYLQQLRDEAHRFAITTHRSKRAKSVTKSSLDEIPGIGKTRKKALLNHFGSLDKIKSATIEDLMRLDGVSKSVAEKIHDFYAP